MERLTAEEIAELRKLYEGGVETALEWRAAALAAHPFLLDEVERLRVVEANQRIVAKDCVAAEADLERASALLKRIEWKGSPVQERERICPECGADDRFGQGHVPNCELWAILTSGASAAQPPSDAVAPSPAKEK